MFPHAFGPGRKLGYVPSVARFRLDFGNKDVVPTLRKSRSVGQPHFDEVKGGPARRYRNNHQYRNAIIIQTRNLGKSSDSSVMFTR